MAADLHLGRPHRAPIPPVKSTDRAAPEALVLADSRGIVRPLRRWLDETVLDGVISAVVNVQHIRVSLDQHEDARQVL